MGTIPSIPENRNRFIPFRKSDIVEMCIRASGFTDTDQTLFRQFCRLLESLIHFEFHRQVEMLKQCYAPFNPDADTRSVYSYSAQEKEARQKRLVVTLNEILDAANYQKITDTDLDEAMKEASLFKIRLRVDFNDFDDVIFYRRGETTKQESIKKFWRLRKETISFTNYERVAVYIKLKDDAYFKTQKRKQLYFKPGSTIIKLFQNVPKADLEMLFPNSEVRMKTFDKLVIGIPAAVSGIAVVASKLGASILLIASVISFWLGISDKEVDIEQKHLIALAVGLATVGGFLFRQINKFKNRKIKYMKTFSENLYFKNLDNNAGVFHHLIDAAEEEEFKEAVLAYFFLLTADHHLTRAELDNTVENWFSTHHNCRINFEIEDALDKLKRWDLVQRNGHDLGCRPLKDAFKQLDGIWDNLFTASSPDT